MYSMNVKEKEKKKGREGEEIGHDLETVLASTLFIYFNKLFVENIYEAIKRSSKPRA